MLRQEGKILFFFCCFFVLIQSNSPAQPWVHQNLSKSELKYNPLRVFFNKFTWGLQTGYGRTFYSQDLAEVDVLQYDGNVYIGQFIERGSTVFGNTMFSPLPHINDATTNYFVPRAPINNPIFNPILGDGIMVRAGEHAMRYRTIGHGIPLTATLHFRLTTFRIGGGYGLERQYFTDLIPKNNEFGFSEVANPTQNANIHRYFFLFGYEIQKLRRWKLVTDMQVGMIRYRANFETPLITRSIFLNPGLSIERTFSEYFTVFLRPSFDYKSYQMQFPELGFELPTRQNALYLNVGVYYNFPEIPRCFMKSCKTQLKHVHKGKEWRGQPIWKVQNPHIGENNPEMFRNKGRNKRKINAY